MSDTGDATSQDELGQLIEGLSDDEITTAVEGLGVDTVIGQVCEAIPQAFNAEKAAGQSAVIQWDVEHGGETKSFHISVADGKCTAAMGPGESPRVTLGFTLPNFLKFVAGKLDGMQAFTTGQLKLGGDMMFAQTMAVWFDN